MKLNKKQHITRRGVVKKNPTHQILIIPIVQKDWKESWGTNDFKKASNVAEKYGASVMEIKETGGTDSDVLYVFKGIPEKKMYEIDKEYAHILPSMLYADSMLELTKKLKKLEEEFE
jgi:hypothetical protein